MSTREELSGLSVEVRRIIERQPLNNLGRDVGESMAQESARTAPGPEAPKVDLPLEPGITGIYD